jgi:outer membrane protein assembly factor BamB
MKKVMKLSLAITVLFVSLNAMASGSALSLRVRTGVGKLVNFSIDDEKSVMVSITSKDKEIIFSETLKSKNGKINRTYDLASFPDGTYFLEAETGAKVSKYEVTVANGGVIVAEKAVAELSKPVLERKDGLVMVSVPDNGKTPVAIRMYDENNVELYKGTVKGIKKFDMNNTAAKNITVILEYSDRTFVETIAAR